jgi:hypothetical protein
LYRLTCKKIHTLEYFGSSIKIFTNKFDPTEFVLCLSIAGQKFARICKIAGNEIFVGAPIQLPYFCAYFEGRFYAFISYPPQSGLIEVFYSFKALHIFEHFRKLKFSSTMSSSKVMSVLMSICPKDIT